MIEQKIKSIYESLKPELKDFHFNLELQEAMKGSSGKSKEIKTRLDDHRYGGEYLDSYEEAELLCKGLEEFIKEGQRIIAESSNDLKEAEELYRRCFRHFLIDPKGGIKPSSAEYDNGHLIMKMDINEVMLITKIPKGLKKEDLFKLEPEDYGYRRHIRQKITAIDAKKHIKELASFLSLHENIKINHVNFLYSPLNISPTKMKVENWACPQHLKLVYTDNEEGRVLTISAFYPKKINFANNFLNYFEYVQREFVSIDQKEGKFESFDLINERERIKLTASALSWILRQTGTLNNMLHVDYFINFKENKTMPPLTSDFSLKQKYATQQKLDGVELYLKISGIKTTLNIGYSEKEKFDQVLIYAPTSRLGEGNLDRIIYGLKLLKN